MSKKTDDIKMFTIGFAQKDAREFFTLLKDAGVKKVIDIRLNNVSQLAAFTKKRDLEYFLAEIASIEYEHRPDFAPTKEILDGFKKKEFDWTDYLKRFTHLMKERRIENLIDKRQLDMACLLCSEPTAEQCHRRLVAEYLREKLKGITITHL